MIADIIIFLLIALFAVIGFRRGLARTFMNIIGIVVTCAISYYLADFLAEALFTSFIRPQVLSELEASINTSGINQTLQNSFSALPDWLMSVTGFVLSLFGVSSQSLVNSFSENTVNATVTAQSITDNLIAPVITAIFSTVITILLFFIVLFIVKKIIKLILKIFEAPVIKQLNRFLGGILGVIEGIIVVFIAVNIFSAVLLAANPQVLSLDYIDGVIFNFIRITG